MWLQIPAILLLRNDSGRAAFFGVHTHMLQSQWFTQCRFQGWQKRPDPFPGLVS